MRVNEVGAKGKTLLELEHRECKWPTIRQPNGQQQWLFCADKCKEGRTYCDVHHGEAFQPGGKRPPPFVGEQR